MLFVLYAVDKPSSSALREKNRPAHIAHVEKHKNHVVTAGPLLANDGVSAGALYILDFPNQSAAQTFIGEDPHVKAGLFQTIALWPFRKVIG